MTENPYASPSPVPDAPASPSESRTPNSAMPGSTGLDGPAWVAVISCGLWIGISLLSRSYDEYAPPLIDMLPFYAVVMFAPGLGLAGAVSMLQRRRYGLCLTGASCMVIPCLGPWFGLTAPLGIWLLILLRRQPIRESFARPKEHGERDTDDPDNALAAASELDAAGDWDSAISLYQEIASRWPEHVAYVDNCVKEIKRKQDAAR